MLRACLVIVWLAAWGASAAAAAEPAIRFEDVTDAAGLGEPLLGIMGHGAAWGDFDADGWPDLFVGGFADRPDAEYEPAAGPPPNRLLRNVGGARFEPVAEAPSGAFARTSGALFADWDGDGDLDLYVSNNARGRPAREGTPAIQRQALAARSPRGRGSIATTAGGSPTSRPRAGPVRTICCRPATWAPWTTTATGGSTCWWSRTASRPPRGRGSSATRGACGSPTPGLRRGCRTACSDWGWRSAT